MHESMEKAKKEVEEICGVAEDIVGFFKGKIKENGCCGVDTSEAGEMTDMIKDLAEAKKSIFEALYFETAAKAMHEDPTRFMPEFAREEMMEHENMGYRRGRRGYSGGRGGGSSSGGSSGSSSSSSGGSGGGGYGYSEGGNGRMGYDHYRYSSGRFAPTGHGHYAGYFEPNWEQEHQQMEHDLRHGAAYRDYSDTRRYYTETKDSGAKMEMNEHAKRHVLETCETVREIYRESDPELKRKIKEELTKLVNEM